jgi:hypothetical protein
MSRNHPVDFSVPSHTLGRPSDSLVTQTDTLIRHIQSRFEQKQSQSLRAMDVRDFHLGFVIKKTLLSNKSGSFPYIRIDLGLIGSSPFMERDKYAKAAALLRQVKREILQQEFIAENIGVHGPPMYRRCAADVN